MKLALFDLDNTLLETDSDYEWAQFLVEVGVLDG
jgi:FMN phosphatase YigB (HAD superfamily)